MDREAPYEAASRLAKIDPAAALTPTVEGIRAARDHWMRHNLVLVLTRLPDEAGWPAVARLLAESEDVDVRFTATESLRHRRPEASVPLFIDAWQRPTTPDYDARGARARLPVVMDYNLPAARERMAQVHAALTGTDGEASGDDSGAAAAGAVRALLADLDLPSTYAQAGVDFVLEQGLLDAVWPQSCTRTNPRTPTEEELRDLYLALDQT